MRSIRIALAAVLALFVLAPAAAMAAPKDPVEALMNAKFHEKGMADTPALVANAGLRCSISNARFIGEDKKLHSTFYEVGCKEGLGYVFIVNATEPAPQVYTCLQTAVVGADGKPNTLHCDLPENANLGAGLQPYVAKVGKPCTIDKARYIGQGQKSAYFEIACSTGGGYVLVTSWPPDPAQPVQMNTCLIYEEGNSLYCEMTDQAAQLAPVNALVAKSGKACTVKDRRYVLATKDGDTYYEVSCSEGKGFMVEENGKGELARMVDCANADFISGGCTMTDARSAMTEQAGLYTRLAAKSGFPCNVSKYAAFPTTGPKEVIEMQCSDRPDGGIGIFTASGGKVYDCVLAEIEGYRCSFTKKELVYPKLTAALRALGKPSCVVSEARVLGKTPDEGFVEVACADGDPGWVMGYANGADTPKEVLSCMQAANFGSGGCTLATNRRR